MDVAELQKKLDKIEAERDKIKMKYGELKTSSESTITGLNDKIEMLEAEGDHMQSQLKTFEKIHVAITNMLLEIKQRSPADEENEKKPSVAGQQSGAALKERNALLKGNPMVVLDQLRSLVRLLLSKKDDYEARLKLELVSAEDRFQLELDGLRREVDELRLYKHNAEDDKRKVLLQVDDAQMSQGLVVKESQDIIDLLKVDARGMVKLLEGKQHEVKMLENKLKQQDQVIEEQEAKMLEFGQIEDEHRKEKREQELETKKIEARLGSQLKELEKDNEVLRKGMLETERLAEKLSKSEQNLQSWKNDWKVNQHQDMKSKVDRLEKVADGKERKIKEQEQNIRRLVHTTESTIDANLQLEKEYKRVFSAAKKRQREMQEQEERSRRERDEAKMAEQNPFYIDTYKRKLMAKEKEIESLKAKIRRMMVSENRGAMVQKTLQAERSRYEKEIAQLRIRASSKTPISSIHSKGVRRPSSATAGSHLVDLGLSRSGADETDAVRRENATLKDRVKELENIRHISETTKEAFNNLRVQHEALEKSYNAEVHRPATAKLQPFSPDPLK